MPDDEKLRIHSNVAAAMQGVPGEIQIRAVARFYQADENCGKGIAEQLAICLDSVLDEVKRQKELGY